MLKHGLLFSRSHVLTFLLSYVPLVAEAIECEWNSIQYAKETHFLTLLHSYTLTFLHSYILTLLHSYVS